MGTHDIQKNKMIFKNCPNVSDKHCGSEIVFTLESNDWKDKPSEAEDNFIHCRT